MKQEMIKKEKYLVLLYHICHLNSLRPCQVKRGGHLLTTCVLITYFLNVS